MGIVSTGSRASTRLFISTMYRPPPHPLPLIRETATDKLFLSSSSSFLLPPLPSNPPVVYRVECNRQVARRDTVTTNVRRDYRAVFTVRGSRVEHHDPFADRPDQEIGLVLQDAGASILTRFLRNHRGKKEEEKEEEKGEEKEEEEKRIEILKKFSGFQSSGPFALDNDTMIQ